MSVALYDRMVKDKIAGWIIDPNMVVFGPDETAELFKHQADITDDKPIQLPLIAISRDRDIDINLTAKRPLTHMGKTFNADGNAADHLNAIPIVIKYQLDIYTRFQAEAHEYVRNFVFNIVNHPSMELIIPYNNSNLSYISYMSLMSPISDNSDIQQRLIPGQFTRMTLRFNLNDAQLFSYNHKTIPKITQIEIKPELKYKLELDIENDIEWQTEITSRLNKPKTKNKVSVKISEDT